MAGLFWKPDSPSPMAAPAAAAPPPPKPVAPMADREDPLIQEAERRRVAAVVNRGLSRKRTILTQGDNATDTPFSKTSMGL